MPCVKLFIGRRFDHESSIEVRKKPERCVTIDKVRFDLA